MNSEMELPGWMRALAVILGFAAIAIGIAILVWPELGLTTLVWLVFFVLIIVGMEMLALGIAASDLSGGMRALNVILGIGAIILAFVAVAYPGLTLAFQIILLAVGLMLMGAGAAFFGGSAKLTKGSRALGIILAILTIVFAILVLAFPNLGAATLIVLLSFGFILAGINGIFIGFAGTK